MYLDIFGFFTVYLFLNHFLIKLSYRTLILAQKNELSTAQHSSLSFLCTVGNLVTFFNRFLQTYAYNVVYKNITRNILVKQIFIALFVNNFSPKRQEIQTSVSSQKL